MSNVVVAGKSVRMNGTVLCCLYRRVRCYVLVVGHHPQRCAVAALALSYETRLWVTGVDIDRHVSLLCDAM